MTRALSVWWDGEIVGALKINRHGEMSFAYAHGWLAEPSKPALSFSLPKREAPFNRRECRPFFEGLLPEESQRESVARALGVSQANEFKLLEELGGDVAGALRLWPEGETPPNFQPAAQAKPLSEQELIDLIETLPKRPFLAGMEGLRLSLAGAQPKLPVVLIGVEIALPAPGQPTTHILKPPIERFHGITENEFFAMTLAREIGLAVAPAEMRSVGDRRFLLVERYDRKIAGAGAALRLHQEDFCQALGFTSERKYAAEGGPAFRDCFDLLRHAATRPAVDVLKLLDAAIFNLIIGNADAHGKNFSLIHRGGAIELAPLYDLLSTVVYPELSPRMAMKIAKRARLEEMKPGDWEKFAEDVGLAGRFVRRRVKELSAAIPDAAHRVRRIVEQASGAAEFVASLSELVTRRAGRAAKA